MLADGLLRTILRRLPSGFEIGPYVEWYMERGKSFFRIFLNLKQHLRGKEGFVPIASVGPQGRLRLLELAKLI